MAAEQPDRREDAPDTNWSYEVHDNVAVFDLTGMPPGAGREELLPVFQKFGEVAMADDITTSLSIVPEEGGISGEAFDLIEENSGMIEQAGLEKLGYVGPHVKGLALKSKLEDGDYEIATFEAGDEALEWGRE